MPDERIIATYRIETPLPLEQATAVLAGEQSSGTFVNVPGETDELRRRYGAVVESITPLDESKTPALPGSRMKGNRGLYRRADVRVSWSIENFGYNLPTVISTLQGNLYELAQFSGLRLSDVEFPDSFGQHFAGPKFGTAGTRKMTGVEGRPLIGTIIKPSIGLSPQQTAELVGKLAAADIDFIKDDELLGNPPHSPFKDRVSAVSEVLNRHFDKTGKKVMYAFNITDELDQMQANYDAILAAGGTCAMISLNSVGLIATKKICDRGQLVIHGHRNGFGAMNRHPLLGIDFLAWQKFWRLAGVDQMHVNGIANKFWEDDDSVVRSMAACAKPLVGTPPVLPVVSSGQTGLQAPETYRRTQTIDLLYQAGGGIMAHPGGPGAGVAALRQAWEAAVAGKTLADYATDHSELRQSVEKFAGAHA
ncbi:MAG: ribulose 1,5-bisphosphate carboxylase [Phycisphaerales bacterium]|nr:ribulose 1,5-bisphosphate carboxylase [Phycisphaerales bacterium]